jgi:hypothetical protein
MSVTFYPGQATADGWEIRLGGHARHHEVNLANTNAVRLLGVLGLPLDDEEGCVGNAPAGDFLGRVLVALAIAPHDEAMPAYQMTPEELSPTLTMLIGAGGAAVWHGPRRDGYLQEKLELLETLARFCVEQDYAVLWA